ncbi:MAG: nucleoside triphosphate pyrophosphohydrolase [Proteobacteria bacterium]|nr:nucleoside triphosphate pyrophosphohydrolase [Pseudomonadota bacterium]
MKKIDQLLDIMSRLRDPVKGCAWDLKQDFASVAPYTIEESYEVADAIDRNDMNDLKNELGDLLFQVVFHAQMAKEAGHFDFADIITAITDKMIDRHPHVFKSNQQNISAEEQSKSWEKHKSKDKESVLDGIATNLPEMLKSVKLTKYAAVIGFDWPEINYVFDKLVEESVELKDAIATGISYDIKDELGDLLFVCTNIARHLDIDPEAALRQANRKFENRFRILEKLAKKEFPKQNEFELEYLDGLWDRVKGL